MYLIKMELFPTENMPTMITLIDLGYYQYSEGIIPEISDIFYILITIQLQSYQPQQQIKLKLYFNYFIIKIFCSMWRKGVGSIYSHSPIKNYTQREEDFNKYAKQDSSHSSIRSFQSKRNNQSDISFNSQTEYQFMPQSRHPSGKFQYQNSASQQSSCYEDTQSEHSLYQANYFSEAENQTSRSTETIKRRPCQIEQSWFDSLTKYGKPAQARQSVIRKLMLINNIFKELRVFKQQNEPPSISINVSAVQDFLLQVEKDIIKHQMAV